MGKIVNKGELSEILGVSERSLTTWGKNGLPVKFEGARGQGHQYDTAEVIEWIKRREISKLTVGNDGEVYDYDAERARLTFHQANKTALEEDVLKGKLIPSEVVEQVQGDMVSAFRARILSVPTKAAHAMIGLDDLSEAKEALKEFIYEALNELSDYRPEQYGIESVGEDSDNCSASTEPDHKRVG